MLYFVLFICFSGLITSVREKRANFLLTFTCNYVVSVRWGFLFLWAALFYCGTTWAFHMVIKQTNTPEVMIRKRSTRY